MQEKLTQCICTIYVLNFNETLTKDVVNLDQLVPDLQFHFLDINFLELCCVLSFSGLFHQVIQQSGSALAHWSVATKETKPNFFYKSFVSTANCYRNTTEEIKQCMQSLDSETLEVIVLNEFEVTILFEVNSLSI